MVIWDNDPRVYGRTTKVDPQHWQNKINGLFGEFGITKFGWNFDIIYDPKLRRWVSPTQEVYVVFTVPETVFDQPVPLQVDAPKIWHRGRGTDRYINWKASMSNLYWYLQMHLSAGYLMGTGAEVEMLAHVVTPDKRTVLDVITEQYKALPDLEKMKVVST